MHAAYLKLGFSEKQRTEVTGGRAAEEPGRASAHTLTLTASLPSPPFAATAALDMMMRHAPLSISSSHRPPRHIITPPPPFCCVPRVTAAQLYMLFSFCMQVGNSEFEDSDSGEVSRALQPHDLFASFLAPVAHAPPSPPSPPPPPSPPSPLFPSSRPKTTLRPNHHLLPPARRAARSPRPSASSSRPR